MSSNHLSKSMVTNRGDKAVNSMDAVKYIKEKERMCEKHPFCSDCPLRKINKEENCCAVAIKNHAEEAVYIVEKWSEEHPNIVNGERVMKNIEEMGAPRATLFPYDTNDICVYFDKDWWDAEYKGG